MKRILLSLLLLGAVFVLRSWAAVVTDATSHGARGTLSTLSVWNSTTSLTVAHTTAGGAVIPLTIPLCMTANTAMATDPSAAASTITTSVIGSKRSSKEAE